MDRRRRSRRVSTGVVAALTLTVACSAAPEPADDPRAGPESAPASTSSAPTPSQPTSSARSAPAPPPVRPGDFDVEVARRAVDRLAGRIGPRHATSAAYGEAARWVADELAGLGYRVRRQPVRVPGGDSWGVPVEPGTSVNIVAHRAGTDLGEPHLVVGAHLDTVPQAPGAEDNASGVGVLLAAGAALAESEARLPVVLIAFGAEEPRGPTDADHHYGSRAYVASLDDAERRGVRGMVSLDRVGVGAAVPVGSAVDGTDPAYREVLAAARRAAVPVVPDLNRSSDHWQFVQAGLPGVRLGSTPYAAYHSARDTPAVIQPAQLARTGRILLAWLAGA